ncbi:MAG: hypothetical protein HY692_09855 [Cyanobacteria bacterium NC_groundwater_1444_Ag_S-0.65um_54_12]|nr:hypothetical protein [Cyanobacteria bacterium NC_groundwater_1444_Ag_S-0.65um_54_12]
MSVRCKVAVISISLTLLVAKSATASMLPPADFKPTSRTVGIGLGYGGGVAVDLGIERNLSAGISFGYLAAPIGNRFDLRLLYQFVNGESKSLTIAGIIGLWADTGFADSPFPFLPPLEGGFALSYPITPQLITRLNLVVPLFSPRRPFDIFGGPAAGVELGYRLRPNLEGTIGLNGQGNLIGLRFHI